VLNLNLNRLVNLLVVPDVRVILYHFNGLNVIRSHNGDDDDDDDDVYISVFF
jgi:hypothetical protein